MTHDVHYCKSCHAPLIWINTQAGKSMPVNAGTVDPDDTVFDSKKHKSHFATCPNANQHRRRKA